MIVMNFGYVKPSMDVTFSCKNAKIKEHDIEQIEREMNKIVGLDAMNKGICKPKTCMDVGDDDVLVVLVVGVLDVLEGINAWMT